MGTMYASPDELVRWMWTLEVLADDSAVEMWADAGIPFAVCKEPWPLISRARAVTVSREQVTRISATEQEARDAEALRNIFEDLEEIYGKAPVFELWEWAERYTVNVKDEVLWLSWSLALGAFADWIHQGYTSTSYVTTHERKLAEVITQVFEPYDYPTNVGGIDEATETSVELEMSEIADKHRAYLVWTSGVAPLERSDQMKLIEWLNKELRRLKVITAGSYLRLPCPSE